MGRIVMSFDDRKLEMEKHDDKAPWKTACGMCGIKKKGAALFEYNLALYVCSEM